MQTRRPIIKLKLSKSDKFLEWFSFACLAITWIVTLTQYSSLPSTIPIHFNFKGEIDNYGSKSTLFLLPAIITVVVLLLTFLTTKPHIFKYPTKITEENAERQYRNATGLLRIIRTVISIFSILFIMEIIRSAKLQHSTLKWWILPLFILSMIIPVFISLISATLKR